MRRFHWLNTRGSHTVFFLKKNTVGHFEKKDQNKVTAHLFCTSMSRDVQKSCAVTLFWSFFFKMAETNVNKAKIKQEGK